ncbi:bifunctional UDP-N-acetylmuramoyl-tripeptide:D-alanyl-D-alanine ligase/alanine racemase [Fibrella forsythiae]|uniref:Alanine racemase n=1 Tax=Fibrella forsythiae TaxID=2817061 RepID=A0ABS3JG64_9BACT|nr:bifunctional UDP-N-acetylmuramoyl-tripeptide:D-alanyl-D-alanine ligase/alanine racemase [Fibrella forsythiae]MBO0947882.1 bifunctional UDP-N-acetylmuramoyl-tripeptide:D-alanyl-D-alanine ligase/alanine racemase [Fibrella forsythiae]
MVTLLPSFPSSPPFLLPFWLTDSRQVMVPAQSVFFAIRGDHHDGHNYIGELYRQGVRQFVIEQPVPEQVNHPDAEFISVPSTVAFMQAQAAAHRASFSIPVIGITGSNGKTIVKEWLAQLLAGPVNGVASGSAGYVVVRSPKSYNSQIGVPLSVRQLNDTHTLAIFEAGISRPHEMAALEAIIKPTIGIFTNIGTAHDEGFKTRKQKVAEKLRLFTGVDTLIYSLDQEEVADETGMLIRAVNPGCQLVGWSREGRQGATYLIAVQGDRLTVTQSDKAGKWTVRTPFTDRASVENLTHCVLTLLTLGITDETELNRRVARLRPVSMRLELKEGINNCVLIDDSYNNDVAGLRLALDFQKQQSNRAHKTVILSDVLQSGQNEADLYTFIGQLLAEQGVSKVLGIGPVISRNSASFGKNSLFFPDTDTFLGTYPTQQLRDSVVLIKGARAFGFERIVDRLQQKVHGTVLHIDLDALTHNLNQYRERVGSQTKIMVMVKAFAYGSGSAEVARLLQFHRVDWLAVAYADEGVFLRQQGITLPIMVMNPSPETFQILLENKLEPELYSQRMLNEWGGFLEGQQALHAAPPTPCHLKIDTGMHRLGFLEAEIPAVVTYLTAHPAVQIATVFSHLAGADEAKFNAFSQEQFEAFSRATAALAAGIDYMPVRHLLNSAGIVRFPEFKLDMVRLGIGLYGVESSQTEPSLLHPVGTLTTTISQIKTVPAGDTVGYSRRGVLDHDSRIATLALGYADGYDRRLGNGVGSVWVNGVLCPTVGSVCMDMTMIDVTNAPASEGDSVEVFGPNVPVTDLSQWMGTIPYEVLTGISERVKRVFFAAG